MDITIKTNIKTRFKDVHFFNNMDFEKAHEQIISQMIFFIFSALDIRFDDHYKMLIHPENVLEALVDVFENCMVFVMFHILVWFKVAIQIKKKHNERYSRISKIEMFRNAFHILDVRFILRLFRYYH